MYAQGYEHFGSLSIPTMLIGVIVRISYCIKRKTKRRLPPKESIPEKSINIKKNKTANQAFYANTICNAANAGKVYFTQNPLAINYTEWITFIKYSLSQLKWTLYEKPYLRDKYVDGKLNEEWGSIQSMITEILVMMREDNIILK